MKTKRLAKLERMLKPEVVVTVNWDFPPPEPEPGTLIIEWDDGETTKEGEHEEQH